MSKSLLIVESPAKARTIGKYLKDVEVKASVGHIKDLPVKRLGVDVEKGFEPEYVTIDGKQKVINDLKKAAKGKDVIYLAPDPDREGEAIAWHIANVLKAKDRNIARVLFHELTPAAIRRALEQPEDLSTARFESQQARRILDRLVGYRLSPLLWDKVKRGLSAGRVQSVALRIICDREREIFAFVPREYWSVTAHLKADDQAFTARLMKKNGKKIELNDKADADQVLADTKGRPFEVAEVQKKERKRYPLPPFTTSQLQQAAYNKLKMSTSKTMSLAQKLYEGIELGAEGSVGLITYMRTDSVRVAKPAVDECRQVIQKTLGGDYLPQKPAAYRNKKGAQDAHEAIRPTSAERTPEAVKPYLSKQLWTLYDLIWRRFVASQTSPAVIDQTTADIDSGPYRFRATGSVVKFPGFLAVYDPGGKDDKETLPPLERGDRPDVVKIDPKQHFTQPPPRFTEATLVKELEENGIGRPSTYASIISVLKDKDYVTAQKGQLRPSELGFIVSDLLVENFPRIMDVEFTAGLENTLDEIEEGKTDWRELLQKFYGPFENDVLAAQEGMRSLKRDGLPTGLTCEKCGQEMVLKYGKNGPFLSCSQYPDCKNAADFVRDDQGQLVPQKREDLPTDETCEKCGAPMVQKQGRYGPFLACSAYPDCKNTRPLDGGTAEELPWPEELDRTCEKCGAELTIKRSRQGGRFIACTNYPDCKNTKPLPTGVACPKESCEGEFVERSSQKGVFYGCSRYPKCRYTLRTRPVDTPCPECGNPFLVEDVNRDGAVVGLKCPAKGCGYKVKTAGTTDA